MMAFPNWKFYLGLRKISYLSISFSSERKKYLEPQRCQEKVLKQWSLKCDLEPITSESTQEPIGNAESQITEPLPGQD